MGTGGNLCPADLGGDANVGIVDFLALLAAWGPCPNATVIDYAVIDRVGGEADLPIRLWSNNRLEITVDARDICDSSTEPWQCSTSVPHLGEWTILDSPLPPPDARPVKVLVTFVSSGSCGPGTISVGSSVS